MPRRFRRAVQRRQDSGIIPEKSVDPSPRGGFRRALVAGSGDRGNRRCGLAGLRTPGRGGSRGGRLLPGRGGSAGPSFARPSSPPELGSGGGIGEDRRASELVSRENRLAVGGNPGSGNRRGACSRGSGGKPRIGERTPRLAGNASGGHPRIGEPSRDAGSCLAAGTRANPAASWGIARGTRRADIPGSGGIAAFEDCLSRRQRV